MDKLVMQENPGPFFKRWFKLPMIQYKLGMGWMIDKYILLLTTTGRKRGKLHHTALEYVSDKERDRYRVAAVRGGHTDWYRNLLKNPKVHVRVGGGKSMPLRNVESYVHAGKYFPSVWLRPINL